MSALTGIAAVGSYSGVTTAGAGIDRLIALIPNPDTTSRAGAQGGGGFLDEISPAACAQLRVDLLALKAVVGLFEAP
jgi:hypothetical protein